jgi:hypothetical protein
MTLLTAVWTLSMSRYCIIYYTCELMPQLSAHSLSNNL